MGCLNECLLLTQEGLLCNLLLVKEKTVGFVGQPEKAFSNHRETDLRDRALSGCRRYVLGRIFWALTSHAEIDTKKKKKNSARYFSED